MQPKLIKIFFHCKNTFLNQEDRLSEPTIRLPLSSSDKFALLPPANEVAER